MLGLELGTMGVGELEEGGSNMEGGNERWLVYRLCLSGVLKDDDPLFQVPTICLPLQRYNTVEGVCCLPVCLCIYVCLCKSV